MKNFENIPPEDQNALLEKHCSKVCTRTGLTILLFSLFCLSLLPKISNSQNIQALAQYVTLRWNLSEKLLLLDVDECFQKAHEIYGEEIIHNWNIHQLLTINCSNFFIEEGKDRNDINNTKVDSKGNKSGMLSAPKITSLLITPLDVLYEISEVLQKIKNNKLLSNARQASLFSELSIYKWQILFYTIEKKHINLLNHKQIKDHVTPGEFSDDETRHIECITLKEIKELSSYQYPNEQTVEDILTRNTVASLPSLGNPMALATLSSVALFVLLLSTVYFLLFFREARKSQYFPYSGTLFAIFLSNKFSKSVFFVLLVIPCSSAVLLGIQSAANNKINPIIALVVLFFFVQIWCEFIRIKNNS